MRVILAMYPGLRVPADVITSATGHNDEVAGRTGRVLAFFTLAGPRAAPPSGWALALDAAVAVGAAVGAVYEVSQRDLVQAVFQPGGAPAPVGRAARAGVPAGGGCSRSRPGGSSSPRSWRCTPPTCRRSRLAPPYTPRTAR